MGISRVWLLGAAAVLLSTCGLMRVSGQSDSIPPPAGEQRAGEGAKELKSEIEVAGERAKEGGAGELAEVQVFDALSVFDGQLQERNFDIVQTVKASSSASTANWEAAQATGAPNTYEHGDKGTAWASMTEDDQAEWLELTFAEAVPVAGVIVHESFNPGAVVRVDSLGESKVGAVLWAGEPRIVAVDAPRLLFCRSRTPVTTNRIRLTIASDAVPGWNEIDAVGILDDQGRVHWAKEAHASSSYAEKGAQNNVGVDSFGRYGPVSGDDLQLRVRLTESLAGSINRGDGASSDASSVESSASTAERLESLERDVRTLLELVEQFRGELKVDPQQRQ
jgi:hypothetical protein